MRIMWWKWETKEVWKEMETVGKYFKSIFLGTIYIYGIEIKATWKKAWRGIAALWGCAARSNSHITGGYTACTTPTSDAVQCNSIAIYKAPAYNAIASAYKVQKHQHIKCNSSKCTTLTSDATQCNSISIQGAIARDTKQYMFYTSSDNAHYLEKNIQLVPRNLRML